MTTYFVAERPNGSRYIAVVYQRDGAYGDGELDINDPDVPTELRDAKIGTVLEVSDDHP